MSFPVAQVGLEPTASLVLSQGGLPIAYRAVCPEQESNPQPPGFKPSRSADWRTWAIKWSRMESNHRFLGVGQVSLPLDHGTVFVQVESPGVAPGSPACGAGVFLLDHDPDRAEAVGLEPTSGIWPPPVFKTGSSSGRMTSVVKLRGLESNQHEDVQSVSSYR